jgi:hypothetical protein
MSSDAVGMRIPDSPSADQAAAMRNDPPRLWRRGGPLIVILAAQTTLASLQHNTAFIDEATYLYAGHSVIARSLHGGGAVVSGWGSYFSGAPFFYPVIGAVFDSLGGLAAARDYSLALMLASTCLLYATTARLFDRRTALFAAGLFAIAPSVIFLSHFATYDAQALFLIALAFWLAVRAGDCVRARPQLALAVVSGIALGAAVVSKYASLALGAPVILLAGLVFVQRSGWWRALGQMGCAAVGVLLVLGTVLPADGSDLIGGADKSTFDRPPAEATAEQVVREFVQLGGPVFLLACLGTLFYVLTPEVLGPRAAEGRVLRCLLGGALTLASLIGLADQLRTETTVSFHKHIAFGLLFAAPMAGLFFTRLTRRFNPSRERVRGWLCVALVVASAASLVTLGYNESQRFYTYGWPDTHNEVSQLTPFIVGTRQNILVETPDVLRYYLEYRVRQKQWNLLDTFTYHVKATNTWLTGIAALETAVHDHYFSLIVLTGDTPNDVSMENQLIPLLAKNDYDIVAQVPKGESSAGASFTIWLLVDK